MYLVKQASEMSGVSVRTLHHYDQIGLLSPKKFENGYRYYSEQDMSTLQIILFYKYLGFSLKNIQQVLGQEEVDRLVLLKEQLMLLNREKSKLLTIIQTLEQTITSQERKIEMSTSDKFKGLKYEENEKYKQAAIDQYGKEVIEEAIEKQKGNEQVITDGFNRIFFAFANNLATSKKATDAESIDLARQLHEHLCHYSFDCSLDVFSSIGFGYVQNPDFKQNLDQFGEGVAQYVCDAIQQYVSTRKNETHG